MFDLVCILSFESFTLILKSHLGSINLINPNFENHLLCWPTCLQLLVINDWFALVFKNCSFLCFFKLIRFFSGYLFLTFELNLFDFSFLNSWNRTIIRTIELLNFDVLIRISLSKTCRSCFINFVATTYD